MRRHFLLLSLLVILFAISGASAETFVQWTAEQRAYVWLKLNQAEILEPTFFRIYRVEQGLDVARSAPDGVDRIQSLQFRVTVPELGKLFDGTEQIVSVVAIPFYVRNVYLP